MAEMTGTEKVVVVEIVETPRKRKALGNSYEVPLGEAVNGVQAGRYKHPLYAMGVVPPEWADGESTVAEEDAEVETEDGS